MSVKHWYISARLHGGMSRMMTIFLLTYACSRRIHVAESRMCLFRNTFVPRFAHCLDSKTPHEKRKSVNFTASPQKSVSLFFLCFSFICRDIVMGATAPPPPTPFQLFEHQGAWIENLFELSSDFDSPIN